MPPARTKQPTPVDAITHADKRANLPTADAQDFVTPELEEPVPVRYPRDEPLDPQLVWKGKDELDTEDLVADAPPIYIQEKIDPRVLIENMRRTAARPEDEPELTLFESFDGLDDLDLVDFYGHEANWSNRMILGDSLNVMASLAERETLRGKVQMIYIDPPYGIKFNSNGQATTRSPNVEDGKLDQFTREVEQIKAFRDTWELGIHSYLTYLRERLLAARELLAQSGSVFVQISNENVHLVRSLLDEVFAPETAVSTIVWKKASPDANVLRNSFHYILWYARDVEQLKSRKIYRPRRISDGSTEDPRKLALWGEFPDGVKRRLTTEEKRADVPLPTGTVVFRVDKVVDAGLDRRFAIDVDGQTMLPPNGFQWRGETDQMNRLALAGRVVQTKDGVGYRFNLRDFDAVEVTNLWEDTAGKVVDKVYVVQTNAKIVERCILLATEPGDLVLDPTCGAGTTAFIAERLGRRWVTIDTSRVALALARQRLTAALFPYFLLADSADGRDRLGELGSTKLPTSRPTDDVRHGFVYHRAPHITLKSIANNPDIIEGMSREEIDAAIQRHADFELLYDKPHDDKKKIRVAGPFTVESLSPHRSLGFAGSAIDKSGATNIDTVPDAGHGEAAFEQSIMANLQAAGIQNGRKGERLELDTVEPYAGTYVQAVGAREAAETGTPERIGITIGPQYGTVGPRFVKDAAREAIRDGELDLLCVLGFAFDPQVLGADNDYAASADGFAEVAAERRLGRIPVLLVRMNADLVMGEDLKKTGAGNLFTVFGEPDVSIEDVGGDELRVTLRGVDVYDPNTGELRSNDTGQIALWMIDTAYDGESFFVRHCYFTGNQKPYERLKKALKAEIDEEAWTELYGTVSRPFARPDSGRVAIKVINDYGDEVLKVFEV